MKAGFYFLLVGALTAGKAAARPGLLRSTPLLQVPLVAAPAAAQGQEAKSIGQQGTPQTTGTAPPVKAVPLTDRKTKPARVEETAPEEKEAPSSRSAREAAPDHGARSARGPRGGEGGRGARGAMGGGASHGIGNGRGRGH